MRVLPPLAGWHRAKRHACSMGRAGGPDPGRFCQAAPCPRSAVGGIAEKRSAEGREVDADLVRAPRHRAGLDQRGLPVGQGLQNAVARLGAAPRPVRLLGLRRSPPPPPPLSCADREQGHLLAVGRAAPDPPRDSPPARSGDACGQGEIASLGGVCGEGRRQGEPGRLAPGDRRHAARALVEAVDDAAAPAAQAPGRRVAHGEPVFQGGIFAARGSVHHEAGRLVENEEVLVLEEDARRRRDEPLCSALAEAPSARACFLQARFSPGGLTARPVRRAGPPPAWPRPPPAVPAVCGPEGRLTGSASPGQRRAKEPRSRSLKATDSHVPALSVSRRRRASAPPPRAPRARHNACLARFRQADSTAPVQPRQGRTPALRVMRYEHLAAGSGRTLCQGAGDRFAQLVQALAGLGRDRDSVPAAAAAARAARACRPPHAADEIDLVGDHQRRHTGPGEDLCESRLHRLRFARPRL